MLTYPIQLPELPYGYTELMPSISKTTLEFHHDKHLKAYIDNYNKAMADCPELHNKPLNDILSNLSTVPSSAQTAIRNNGGGVFNHFFYFDALTTPKTSKPSTTLMAMICEAFGSEEKFRAEFKAAALSQFGSGWAWLVMDANQKLSIIKTANQDTPLALGYTPLLTIDVWEHAYYLDYQNLRPNYIDAYFDIINWAVVENRLSHG